MILSLILRSEFSSQYDNHPSVKDYIDFSLADLLLKKYDLGKYNTPHQLKTEKTEDANSIDLSLRKT